MSAETVRPKRSVERIAAEAEAIRWWVDAQIARGRTDDEIVALAPAAIAFIVGDLTLAELTR